MLVFLIMSVGGVIVCVMVAAVAFSCNWSWYHGACSALRKRMRHQTIRFSLLRLFIRLVGENGIDLVWTRISVACTPCWSTGRQTGGMC